MSGLPRGVRTGSLLFAVTAALAGAIAVAALLARSHLGPAADRYLEFLPDEAATVTDIREILTYTIVCALATVLVGGALAVLVRQPRPWVRTALWIAALVLGLALGTGLVAGVDPAGASPGDDSTPAARLFYDLVPGWYPSVNAVLGLLVLISLGAAAFSVLRSSALDFYRAASHVEDPRWSSFVARRQSDQDG